MSLKRLLILHSLLNVKQICLSPVKSHNWRTVLKILCHILFGRAFQFMPSSSSSVSIFCGISPRSSLCLSNYHLSLYFAEDIHSGCPALQQNVLKLMFVCHFLRVYPATLADLVLIQHVSVHCINDLLPAKLFGHHMFHLTTFLLDIDPMG